MLLLTHIAEADADKLQHAIAHLIYRRTAAKLVRRMARYRQPFEEFRKKVDDKRQNKEHASLDKFIRALDLFFATNDKLLAAGHADGLAHLWAAPPDPLAEQAAEAPGTAPAAAANASVAASQVAGKKLWGLSYAAHQLLDLAKWPAQYGGGDHD
jgi:hypothetical protein